MLSLNERGTLRRQFRLSVGQIVTMSDELDILTSVKEHFDAAGIPHMVTGSMAVNFYATPRMTRDIDLGVERSKEDID